MKRQRNKRKSPSMLDSLKLSLRTSAETLGGSVINASKLPMDGRMRSKRHTGRKQRAQMPKEKTISQSQLDKRSRRRGV